MVMNWSMKTIERNVAETAVNGSILITNITSDVYIVVFDVNDVNGIGSLYLLWYQ